jgi:hypothetical protein
MLVHLLDFSLPLVSPCLAQATKQVGVGLTLASMGMAAYADGAVPGAGVGPVGEVSIDVLTLLVPDVDAQ